MTETARKLLDDALGLPPEDRRALAEALMDSVDDDRGELSAEWKAELAARIAQIERGEVHAVPWSEVEARIRRTLGRGMLLPLHPEDLAYRGQAGRPAGTLVFDVELIRIVD